VDRAIIHNWNLLLAEKGLAFTCGTPTRLRTATNWRRIMSELRRALWRQFEWPSAARIKEIARFMMTVERLEDMAHNFFAYPLQAQVVILSHS